MKKDKMPKPDGNKDNTEENNKEGYPLYPPKDDIYNNFKEVKSIDLEDLKNKKEPFPEAEAEEDEITELGEDEVMGGDLDVPGSDLDDEEEEIGSEDEENNYYSIGGDNHTDLEEDNGE